MGSNSIHSTVTLLSVSLATLVALAGSAAATPAIAGPVDVEPEPRGDRRFEVDLGMLVGGSDLSDQQRKTWGLHLNAGRRFGDLVLLGEYDYLTVGKGSSLHRGTMSRAGLVARYSLLRTDSSIDRPHRRKPVSGDYWFEAGAGVQRVAWDEGGTLTRPDVVLGFGWQFNVVIDRKSDSPRYYGPYVAFRANISRAPGGEMDETTTCGGPCDTATSQPGTDVSMYLHLGINWGR